MDPREVTREHFLLNPCTISTCYAPLIVEFWDSLEILALYEAFAFAFSGKEGPLPRVPDSPAWNRHIVNHTLYPTNSPYLDMAWYWQNWIRWFWLQSSALPLDLSTIWVLKRDISQLLFQRANIQVTSSSAGILTIIALGTPPIMTPSCYIVTSRTDFLCPINRINTSHLGLRLRETFDSKQRPRIPWSHDRYLELHAQLCAATGEPDHLPDNELSD